jgi:chromatin remodeling complex protein RSC6
MKPKTFFQINKALEIVRKEVIRQITKFIKENKGRVKLKSNYFIGTSNSEDIVIALENKLIKVFGSDVETSSDHECPLDEMMTDDLLAILRELISI